VNEILNRLVGARNAHRDNPSGETYVELWEAIKAYDESKRSVRKQENQ